MSNKHSPSHAGLTRQEFESRLIARAWKDPEFKARLLSNPKAVFEEHLGVQLPPEFQMKVLEESPDQLYLVLPPTPEESPDTELSEEEMELVAGGTGLPVFLLSMLRPRPKQ